MSSSVAVNVHLYHPTTELVKIINCFVISKTDYDGATQNGKALGELRRLLVNDSSVKSSVQFLPFCTSEGAEVQDTTGVSDYYSVLPEKDSSASTLTQYSVYFKARTGPGENPLKPSKDPETSVARVKANGSVSISSSEYDSGDWRAGIRAIEFDHPVDMTERQWSAVLRSTNILSGNVVTFTPTSYGGKDAKVPQLQRAMYPAFRIKPRELLQYEKEDLPASVESQIVRIPVFQVTDDAYVEAYETSSFMERSMAGSSFSQTDVEASAGGGGFGFSASVTAGFSKEDQESWSQSHSSSESMMHVTYNFPRVVLLLNEYSLDMDEQCVEDLKKIDSELAYVRFHQKYGQIFPQRVLLGGKLYSSRKSSSFGSSTESQKSESMKVSASMSFKAPFVQASASASHENGSSEGESVTVNTSNGTLSWHAIGGDTLLCNNPPAWCATVASHYYWRVQQQTEPLPILDFINKFPMMFQHVQRAKNHAPQ